MPLRRRDTADSRELSVNKILNVLGSRRNDNRFVRLGVEALAAEYSLSIENEHGHDSGYRLGSGATLKHGDASHGQLFIRLVKAIAFIAEDSETSTGLWVKPLPWSAYHRRAFPARACLCVLGVVLQ